MIEAEFDAVVADYRRQHAQSVGFMSEDLDYFARYKIEELAKICRNEGLNPGSILDFGAGIGNSLKPLRNAFPKAAINCLDVSEESLKLCEQQGVSNMTTHAYDGKNLPFADGTIDVAFTACVFHHIPEADHIALLSEIRRCLCANGRFILFEHNPYNPLTQLAVKRCPFDEHAVLITAQEMKRRFEAAGFATVKSRYHVFFPEKLSALRPMESILAWLPLGGQYSLDARP
ncbi:MAG: SAM-dependent methyltransferase [Parasphingorhabdus sp.]|mgnify:CR=1 FL=1|jgi:SAM-dependent methyltransferase|uniref:class I SAM-dependent methyltransferase n=1 Tax=Parasphingorhabdus sp. TaxID=2709688 RepID=UPI0039E549D3|tara:strand:- start:40092 stop:40784 length:693 start_codon:yes stop_codon:yes gene_type:complete